MVDGPKNVGTGASVATTTPAAVVDRTSRKLVTRPGVPSDWPPGPHTRNRASTGSPAKNRLLPSASIGARIWRLGSPRHVVTVGSATEYCRTTWL